MKSETNLTRHIEAAATKGTWWSLPGSHELFGVPEGTHAPLGTVQPQYGTRMAEADFQRYVAEWRAFLKARQPARVAAPAAVAPVATAPASQSPDGICIAGRNDGTRCPNAAKAGYICGSHAARPGLAKVTPHPSIVPALTAIAAGVDPTAVVPATPVVTVAPVAPVTPQADVMAAIAALGDRFEARFVALEEQATKPTIPKAPEAPAEPEEESKGLLAGLLGRARSNA